MVFRDFVFHFSFRLGRGGKRTPSFGWGDRFVTPSYTGRIFRVFPTYTIVIIFRWETEGACFQVWAEFIFILDVFINFDDAVFGGFSRGRVECLIPRRGVSNKVLDLRTGFAFVAAGYLVLVNICLWSYDSKLVHSWRFWVKFFEWGFESYARMW